MVRGLAVWAAATALAGFLAAQERPLYIPPWIMERALIYQPEPVYPQLAKEARIAGAVKLLVWVSPDGDVKGIHLIGGHPLLVKAAMDAVKQWRYDPGMWWERPVNMVTTVTVNFTLSSDGAPQKPGGEQTIIHVSERDRCAQKRRVGDFH
jgi:TonB family protein